MTSQNTKAKYKCAKCKDTGWISGPNGFYRCECYKKEVLERRWKRFGVDPNSVKKINDYKPITSKQTQAKEMAIKYVKDFKAIISQRNNSVAFLGQPGAGKTHLTLGIGKALIEKGTEVIYMPYLEVIRELKANAMDEESYNRFQSKYINCELLIIDDLFKDKVKKGKLVGELKESDMKHIYPIINQRYAAHKPTVYSSECNLSMLMDLDEALGGRIYESCKENIVVFKYGKENNYRLKDL